MALKDDSDDLCLDTVPSDEDLGLLPQIPVDDSEVCNTDFEVDLDAQKSLTSNLDRSQNDESDKTICESVEQPVIMTVDLVLYS